MACCVVGSLLTVAVVWCVRTFRQKVLGRPPDRPEEWRLDMLDAADQTPHVGAAP